MRGAVLAPPRAELLFVCALNVGLLAFRGLTLLLDCAFALVIVKLLCDTFVETQDCGPGSVADIGSCFAPIIPNPDSTNPNSGIDVNARRPSGDEY